MLLLVARVAFEVRRRPGLGPELEFAPEAYSWDECWNSLEP